jgi:hypothetical protein
MNRYKVVLAVDIYKNGRFSHIAKSKEIVVHADNEQKARDTTPLKPEHVTRTSDLLIMTTAQRIHSIELIPE